MGIRSDEGLFSFAIGLVLWFVLPFVPTFLVASVVALAVLTLATGVGDFERAFTIGAWIGAAVGGYVTVVEAIDYAKRHWRDIVTGMLLLLGILVAFAFIGSVFG
jgi:hypothetical protein